LLAIATSPAFFAVAQGVPSVIAEMLFPTGFIIINLLGIDLITGYFALVPLAWPNASDTSAMEHAPRADRAATTTPTPSAA
jgi:formate/nitrite transporter FocA (FNT family)